MVGIVLGILAALVAGAVLAFVVMKHLRKKKKGGLLSVRWTLVRPVCATGTCYGGNIGMNCIKSFNQNIPGVSWEVHVLGLMIKNLMTCFSASMVESRLTHSPSRSGTNNMELLPVGDYRRGDILAEYLAYCTVIQYS